MKILTGGEDMKQRYLAILLFGMILLGSELVAAEALDTTGFIFLGDGKQKGYGYSIGLYQTLVEGIVGSYSEYFEVPYPIKQVTQVAFFKINMIQYTSTHGQSCILGQDTIS
ncbi:exported hypothetical protein [Thermococcus barophilus]|uniref:Uncharacterized protein n=2 Tax=Thermococcus barophilus TaxID=55802 RepID=A0A0S1X8S3_THEBA|nr:exported hypothetical protein [Thermococcus barophilus]